MASSTRTDEATYSSDSVPPTRERGRSGHIGLIVLGSIVAGLVLGLVLVLGVFGGSDEATITGAALISLGAGMLILFLLAGRRTDQPQPWALVPAIAVGALGLALLIIRPGDRLLGWTGWIWPILIVLLVVWSVRGARRSLRNWSRRWLLYPALAVLGLVALGGAYETVAEATTSNPAHSTGRTYLVEGHRLSLAVQFSSDSFSFRAPQPIGTALAPTGRGTTLCFASTRRPRRWWLRPRAALSPR